MSQPLAPRLLTVAAGWRLTAAQLLHRHGGTGRAVPDSVSVAVVTLEACAQRLEDEIQPAPAPVPPANPS